MMELLITCPFCGKEYSVMVNEENYYNWYFNDLLVQEAFPDLTATERECLISHICPECQGEIFGTAFDEQGLTLLNLYSIIELEREKINDKSI